MHLEFLEEHIPPTHLYDYVLAYKALAALEDSTFGSILYLDYEDGISDFATAYKKLNLSITPKVIVCVVVRTVCASMPTCKHV